MQPTQVNVVEFFAPEEIEAMAQECGFVQRRSPVTGLRFLLTLTTGLLNTPDGTLAQLAAFLGSTCGATVSPQAVDERMGATAKEFLGRCLRRALAMAAAIPPGASEALAQFSHVYVVDSTNFTLHPALAPRFKGSGGNASPAAMRIQFAFDYRTHLMHLELGDVRLTDTDTLARLVDGASLPVDDTSLFLADLGYFKVATFERLRRQGHGHFLSKLQYQVPLTNPDHTPLALKALLQHAPAQFDLPVKLGQTVCRLVGQRLSDEAANRRVQKAAEAAAAKSRQLTDDYRLFLRYALFVTSLPPTYAMGPLFTLYRIRWQVELTFKVWKSILAIHVLHSAKEPRVLCEVYGKLIVAVMISCLNAAARACVEGLPISPHKIARHLRAVATNWALAIIAGPAKHGSFLATLGRAMARFCRKSCSTRKPTLEKRLRQALPPTASPATNLPVTP
jgi:hypothetical protein